MTRYEFPHSERASNTQDYICPHCHSSNFDNIDGFLEDDYYCYESKCQDCGTLFREWYHLTFSEVDWVTKEEMLQQEQGDTSNSEYDALRVQQNESNIEAATKMVMASGLPNAIQNELLNRLHNEYDPVLYSETKWLSMVCVENSIRLLKEECCAKPTADE